MTTRPFLKWAGGKGQLLGRLTAYFPKALTDGSIDTYYEPFVGGGAMFFHLMQTYPIRSATLMDANPELILTYQVVKNSVETLVPLLGQMERDFLKLSEVKRKARFLKVREAFNKSFVGINFQTFSSSWVERAAQLIFLNKTCFNGLFRVNRRGSFNVPFGSYLKPTILDEINLRNTSALLAKAKIQLGDFDQMRNLSARSKSKTFIYYDPPYRPLSRTANFNAYNRTAFGDPEQKRLAQLFKDLDRKGCYQMLSNSDPKNTDSKDNFFEHLYSDYVHYLYRIPASRSINSNAARRGLINEIVITNYKS